MASDDATSVVLARKRSIMELMPPPPAPKKIKRPKTVLDEDAYTEGLSKIIARDFFPGLLESETQQEYLDALDSKDQGWISSAGRRLQHVMTPGRQRTRDTPLRPTLQTPRGYVGDTPASTVSTLVEKKPEVDTNMSLSSFQSKYTSEDNESFYKLVDRQNQKRAEKYAWLWRGNKLPSKMQLKQKEIEAKLGQTRSLLDDGFENDRLAIKEKDDRPAAPDTWKADPKSALMFGPQGIDDSLETVAQRAQVESRAGAKAVVYENTRMPNPNIVINQLSAPPSPSLSAIRDAIAGKARPEDRDSVVRGDETPRVNGYAFVDDEEPELKAERTPVIDLGPGESAVNPFQLQEQSKRETLHRRMVERIAESKRTSARVGMTGKVDKTPLLQYPSSPSVSRDLTPAAQRLWTSMGGSKTSGATTPFDGRATPRAPKLPGLKSTSR